MYRRTNHGITITYVTPSQLSPILGNPGVTRSVPTAFIMNAMGTEWVTPGLARTIKSILTQI